MAVATRWASASSVLAHTRILHRDAQLVVVDKPAGVPCVPTRHGSVDLVHWLTRNVLDGSPPRVVHRLDTATSGVVVFALTPHAQAWLCAQWHRGAKAYEAEVHTSHCPRALPPPAVGAAGSVLSSLARHQAHRLLVDGVPQGTPGSKPCATHYRVMDVCTHQRRALLRLSLVTGRTHQLRAHCALPPPFGLGWPVVGDVLYAWPQPLQPAYTDILESMTPGAARDGTRLLVTEPRLQLHAASVTLLAPPAEPSAATVAELSRMSRRRRARWTRDMHRAALEDARVMTFRSDSGLSLQGNVYLGGVVWFEPCTWQLTWRLPPVASV